MLCCSQSFHSDWTSLAIQNLILPQVLSSMVPRSLIAVLHVSAFIRYPFAVPQSSSASCRDPCQLVPPNGQIPMSNMITPVLKRMELYIAELGTFRTSGISSKQRRCHHSTLELEKGTIERLHMADGLASRINDGNKHLLFLTFAIPLIRAEY